MFKADDIVEVIKDFGPDRPDGPLYAGQKAAVAEVSRTGQFLRLHGCSTFVPTRIFRPAGRMVAPGGCAPGVIVGLPKPN